MFCPYLISPRACMNYSILSYINNVCVFSFYFIFMNIFQIQQRGDNKAITGKIQIVNKHEVMGCLVNSKQNGLNLK